MAFLSKKTYARNGTYTGQRMYHEGGYREKNVMNRADFIVGSKKNNTITFYAKHKKDGRFDSTKYDTACYSLKNKRWIS